jgi:hypothetical protein
MAAKAKASLEEGLNHSANKRGFTGKERHRYIGGALHNMGKSKPRSGGKGKAPKPHRASTAAHTSTKPTTIKKTYTRPTITKKTVAAPAKAVPPKDKVALVVRQNKSASTKGTATHPGKTRYSIYNSKTNEMWGSGTYGKSSIANHEAKIEQDAYNGGYKRGRLP